MTPAQILKMILDLCAESERSKLPLDTAEVKLLATQAYGFYGDIAPRPKQDFQSPVISSLKAYAPKTALPDQTGFVGHTPWLSD